MSFALAESMFGTDGAAECDCHAGEVDNQLVRERDASLICREQVHMQMGVANVSEDDVLPREGLIAAFSIVVQNHFVAVDGNRVVGTEFMNSVLTDEVVYLFGECMAKDTKTFAIQGGRTEPGRIEA